MMQNIQDPVKLTERAKIIFKLLVECYIHSGEPVGSKMLSEKLKPSLSSATVRHVLADLEALGYLHSPHTSAGRIPTPLGYRLFVDTLLTMNIPCQKTIDHAKQSLNSTLSLQHLLSTACTLASGMTSMTSIITIPKKPTLLLSHVEFLPLADHKILAVLIFNGQEIQNRIISPDKPYTVSELQQISNYINTHFIGLDLRNLKKQLTQKIKKDTKAINQLLTAIIENWAQEPDKDFVLSGETHLFDFADTQDMPKLREIFSAFNQKRDILYLLEQCLQTEGVHIYIGEETGYAPLETYSVIGAPYSMNHEISGVLAIIGPIRMAYGKIIPALEMTAKLLSIALNKQK